MSLLIAGSACVSVMAQDDISAVKKQIADLESKLTKLEAKSASSQAAPASALPGNLTFHGYLRGRYEMSEAENNTFQSTEIALQPRWDASDRIHGEAHLWFYPAGSGTIYTESAMMIVDELGIGKGSKMIFGKTRNMSYGIVPTGPNRLLSNYSLYSDAFTHDRVWGVQSLNKLDSGNVDLNISLINGYTIGRRGVGIALFSGNNQKANPTTNNMSTQTLSNREETSGLDTNNNKALSMRISGKVAPKLELGLSGYTARLSDTDAGTSAAAVAAGTGLLGYTGDTPTKRRHTMLGGDFRYKDGAWVWQAEGTSADIGGMKYKGLQTAVGYTVDDNDSVYVQYGQLNYAPAADPNFTATWDKSQVSVSWKHNLAKAAWIQVEHEFNREKAPATASKVDNDITFIEYLVAY
jgi:hypothetical protein